MVLKIAIKVHKILLKQLVVLFACACVLGGLSGCSHRSSTIAKEIDKEGTQYQRAGIMSKSEHQRIADIQARIMPNGKLSESEVDWLLSLGQRSGTEQQKAQRMQWVALTFASGNHDTVPASRRDVVFNFATQATKFTGDNVSTVRQGCLIFRELGDKRAVPYLEPLLPSNNSDVARAARQTLHALSKQP